MIKIERVICAAMDAALRNEALMHDWDGYNSYIYVSDSRRQGIRTLMVWNDKRGIGTVGNFGLIDFGKAVALIRENWGKRLSEETWNGIFVP